MSNKSEKLEEDKQGGNSCQINPSSSTGIPLQGQDNTSQPQNPYCSVASQTQLVLPPRTLSIEPNRSAPRVDNRARAWMGRSPILLRRTGAEMVNAHSRVRPEYTHAHRKATVYQAAPRPKLENNVIILRDNRQVNVALSLNSPRPMEHDRYTDNIPIVISSGFSTYILEDNEEGEGSSYGFKRVSCKRRTMNGIAPSGWLALGKNSGAITSSRGSSRNIRQRSKESNTELLQLLPKNHHTGVPPFSAQLRANTHYPYTHFRSPMVPPQMLHQVNVSPLANNYMNPRPGVNYLISRGGDRSSTPRSSLNNHQWIFSSNPMRNPAVQLPKGNPRNQIVPHQNRSSSVDHNNLLMPGSSHSSPGVAFKEPRERSSNQALVSTQRRSVGIVIKEPGSSPLSSSTSSSAGAGGDIPKADSSSADVVPTKQRSGKEVVPHTDSQILYVISEESSEEEFIYEEFDDDDDDDESSDDESEDLDFEANDLSFEDFLEFEEEKGGPSSGLNPDDIEKFIKKTKYEPTEVSIPQKQKSCPICWEDYVDEDDIGKLQCEHGYHLQCLKKWLEITNNCPVCEKTILMDE